MVDFFFSWWQAVVGLSHESLHPSVGNGSHVDDLNDVETPDVGGVSEADQQAYKLQKGIEQGVELKVT